MGFKIKAPYKKDPTPVYEVPFDNPNLIAKANKNGTIIVNKEHAKNGPLMKEAMAHEKHHLKDMMKGDLDYDSESVTYKGKKYDRNKFNEGNSNLPWEAPAYKAGKEGKEPDLTPNPKKLNGPPSMKDDSPASFKKMGNKWNQQEADQNSVKANENFGMPMKRWGGPSAIGGTDEEKKKASTKVETVDPEKEKSLKQKAQDEANANLAKMDYKKEVLPDGRIRYYKEATGDATETSSTPGKGSGVIGIGYAEAYKNADKEKYPTFEDFKAAAIAYNEKNKPKQEYTTTETATASDEYFEKEPDTPGTPPPGTPPPSDPPPSDPPPPPRKGSKRKKTRSKKLKQNLETTKDTKVCRVDDKRKFCLADMFDDKKGDSRRKVMRKARRQRRKFRKKGGRY